MKSSPKRCSNKLARSRDKLKTFKRKSSSNQAPTKRSLSQSLKKSRRNSSVPNARSTNSTLLSPSLETSRPRSQSFQNSKRSSSSGLPSGTTAMSSTNCKRSGFQIRLKIRMPMRSSKLYASTTPRTQGSEELSSESKRKTKF